MRTLSEWLAHQERVHPQSIDLGLGRLARVLERLGWRQPRVPVITVAGTNGKGSVAAYSSAMLAAAGLKVGTFTSPHLRDYRERIRIADAWIDARSLTWAFERIERACGQGERISLTFFEYNTLAALLIFEAARLDAWVLEIGMGGRLDAVNVFDADCAIVTSVGLDHMDYLGNTREAIGYEKAGIFRAGRPAVIADPEPPASVLAHAQSTGAKLLCIGRDFGYARERGHWSFWGPAGRRSGLPEPALQGAIQLQNASAVLAALDTQDERLPVSADALRRGLTGVRLGGRFQLLPGRPTLVLDVGHNPQAAAVLAQNLADLGPCSGTAAVFGMLRDKDIAGVVKLLVRHIDRWYACTLPPPRGAQASELAQALRQAGVDRVREFENPARAYAAACSAAAENDRIIVFGSFHTVADVIAARENS